MIRQFFTAAVAVFPLTGCLDTESDRPEGIRSSIDACAGNPWTAFTREGLSAPTKDSEAYVVPTISQRGDIKRSMTAFRDSEYAASAESASEAGYRLCRQTNNSGQHTLFWIPATRGEGQARWAVRAHDGAGSLVVQVPHGMFESGTLEQGRQLFDDLDARALVASGTHRCANQTPSGCSGTTSVCGVTNELYRESDMAHSVESLFHTAAVALADQYSSALAISLHGMGADGISLSDGTTDNTSDDSTVARLATELSQALPDERVTACNAFDGAVETADRLCGTTNTQGRALNESPDACSQGAAQASGRFLHLEQSLPLRESADANRALIQATD